MRRRALLASAAALGTVAVTGCLTDALGGDETTADGTTTEATTTAATTASTTTTPPLEVTDRRIDTGQAACGGENTGSISFSDDGATVEGSIRATAPCHEATFANVRVLGGVVEVTVGTTPTDAEACQQCIAHVEYTGTVRTNVDPHSVVLVHEYTPEGEDEPVTTVVADRAQ